MYEILSILGFLILIIGTILLISLLFSPSKPMSEYDIYGPDGADEWERKQMGLTIEEYEQYLKDGYIKKNKND